MIEASANIVLRGMGVRVLRVIRVDDDEIVQKMCPPPPSIDTRRGGVHVRGELKSSSSPRIGGAQWVTTVENTLWATE